MMQSILVVIDGCRPDMLLAAHTPHLREMMALGAHSLEGKSVLPPITTPAHFSIFTGMKPISHGVLTNAGNPRPAPEAMGIMDWARLHGRGTAAFINWAWLRHLFSPGAAGWSVCMDRGLAPDSDQTIARAAADYLADHPVDFCFLYLGHPDEIGHQEGYESPAYGRALERADQALGEMRETLARAGREYRWLVVSDHGGKDRDHQIPGPEVMTVPWIACGPGIKAGHVIGRPVGLVDVAPTLAGWLDLPPLPLWEGTAVDEVLA